MVSISLFICICLLQECPQGCTLKVMLQMQVYLHKRSNHNWGKVIVSLLLSKYFFHYVWPSWWGLRSLSIILLCIHTFTIKRGSATDISFRILLNCYSENHKNAGIYMKFGLIFILNLNFILGIFYHHFKMMCYQAATESKISGMQCSWSKVLIYKSNQTFYWNSSV